MESEPPGVGAASLRPPLPEFDYVDVVTLRAQVYTDYPRPENLESAAQVQTYLGTRLDRVGLLQAIHEVIPWPHQLQEQYTETGWGADGAAIQILVAVAGGSAVVVLEKLLEVVRAKLATRDHGHEGGTTEDAVRQAR